MTPAEAKELHATYCRATGLQLSMGFARERAWAEFMRAGFTRSDLALVIGFLQRGIKKGERNEGALRFRNLVEQLDHFEEELAMARKAAAIRPRPEIRPAPRTTPLGPGQSVTVIDPAPKQPQEDGQVGDIIKREMEKFYTDLGIKPPANPASAANPQSAI